MKNFIMLLTYSRIVFGPLIFVLSVFFEMYLASLVIFILCSVSDFLDGYLASKFNQESSLGKLLDPIADKILLCSTILAIILITNDYFIGLMGVIILVREFWVSGLREYNAINHIHGASDVSFLAKIKTTLQFIAIGSYLFARNLAGYYKPSTQMYCCFNCCSFIIIVIGYSMVHYPRI